MNKLLTTLTSAALLATVASADMARVEMGGGMWKQTPSGTLSYADSTGATGTYTSSKKEVSNAYAWMLIKHPIPVIPNIRLEYAKVSDEGTATGSFKGFSAPTGAPASIDITQYDIIPYYNLLDNTAWVTLDLGVDIKVADTKYRADGVTITGVGTSSVYEDSTTLILPMLYVRTRVEIPSTDIGLEADAKYVSYNGSTAYDIRAKVDYTLGFIPVVQPAIEIGYRVEKFDLVSDDKKTNINIDFAGVYAGLMLRF